MELISWFLALFTSLTGFTFPIPLQPATPARLTAEQVIDLEVQAWAEYLEQNGSEQP